MFCDVKYACFGMYDTAKEYSLYEVTIYVNTGDLIRRCVHKISKVLWPSGYVCVACVATTERQVVLFWLVVKFLALSQEGCLLPEQKFAIFVF